MYQRAQEQAAANGAPADGDADGADGRRLRRGGRRRRRGRGRGPVGGASPETSRRRRGRRAPRDAAPPSRAARGGRPAGPRRARRPRRPSATSSSRSRSARRRTSRTSASARRASRALAEPRGVAKVVSELLPALDNLERALAAAESQPDGAEHHLAEGIRLVQAELVAAMARVGVEGYSPQGRAVRPERARGDGPAARRGRRERHDRRGLPVRATASTTTVIRPARVIVAA